MSRGETSGNLLGALPRWGTLSWTNNPWFLIRPFNYCLRMSGLRHWSGPRSRSGTRVQRVGRGQGKELECRGDNEPLGLAGPAKLGLIFPPLSRKQVKITAVGMAQVPAPREVPVTLGSSTPTVWHPKNFRFVL